uniref:Uncharacterized protein n=1 Tax=Periophthalmus magnuspinnatus TaxID=409849 RepID=A0A3B3ZB87_9GOBI
MASLYQRFSGKINTANSFPHPPEASHLLGGQVVDEDTAARTPQPHVDGRPHVQYRKKCPLGVFVCRPSLHKCVHIQLINSCQARNTTSSCSYLLQIERSLINCCGLAYAALR